MDYFVFKLILIKLITQLILRALTWSALDPLWVKWISICGHTVAVGIVVPILSTRPIAL